MKLNILTCTDCHGRSIDECDKYCKLRAAMSLRDTINSVSLTPTNIGEYSRRIRGGKTDLMVSGHRLDSDDISSKILTGIETPVCKKPTFNIIYEKGPVALLTDLYKAEKCIGTPEAAETINRMLGVMNNKQLLVPFRVGTIFNVDISDEKDQKKSCDMQLAFIKWTTNAETKELVPTLYFERSYDYQKRKEHYQVKEYLIKFRPSKNQTIGVNYDEASSLIHMENTGFINPINIRGTRYSIGVDGKYIYDVTGSIRIIGEWEKSNNFKLVHNLSNEIARSDAMNFLKKSTPIIYQHKGYILPYYIGDINKIDIR